VAAVVCAETEPSVPEYVLNEAAYWFTDGAWNDAVPVPAVDTAVAL